MTEVETRVCVLIWRGQLLGVYESWESAEEAKGEAYPDAKICDAIVHKRRVPAAQGYQP